MSCPRCGHTEIPGDDCPRCGLILSKYRGERRTPAAATLDAPPQERPGRPAWATLLLLAGVAAAAFLAIGIWRRSVQPRRAESSPAVSAPELPSPAPESGGLEPPMMSFPSPSPVSAAELERSAPGLTREERDASVALSMKLARPDDVRDADVAEAEGLVSRHPEEPRLRELCVGLLLARGAVEQQASRFDAAGRFFRRAIDLAPSHPVPRLALMSVLLQSGDWVGAEGTAREALGLAPGNADAQRGLALALFRQDRNREAADVLRSMLAVRDDGAARELLARILKTGSDESGMTEQRLAHFHVRYDGDAHDAVGREILSALERHYAALTIAMDHQPGVTIPVILFSRQNYYDANGMPFWAGGHYDETDGRVRIPIGDLTPSLTPGLDGVLIHELTHAFIADMTKATAPREIHEGLAQYMEGKRLDTLLERDQLSALARGRIGGVGGFYLSALGFVEHLMASRGQGGMNELLRAMGETRNVDEAFRRVYDRNFQAAYAEWRERFQRTEGG